MESKQLLMVGNMKDNLKMIFIKEKESIQKKIKNNIIKANLKMGNFMEKEDFITIKIFIFKELLIKVNFRKLVKYFIPMEIDIKDMCKIKNLMDLESLMC